jgi:tRNA (guanine37-N1)-methyltransferase
MDFEVLTLFPDMVDQATRFGVIGRALERDIWRLRCWNPRDQALDAYRRVDDRPFGGGPGMVMLAEPLVASLLALRIQRETEERAPARVIHGDGGTSHAGPAHLHHQRARRGAARHPTTTAGGGAKRKRHAIEECAVAGVQRNAKIETTDLAHQA